MGTINLNGFFEERKKEILDKLTRDIIDCENYINGLSNIHEYKQLMDKQEMILIQLRELHRKIGNIQEDI